MKEPESINVDFVTVWMDGGQFMVPASGIAPLVAAGLISLDTELSGKVNAPGGRGWVWVKEPAPRLDRRAHTVAQFTAAYFGHELTTLDYSQFGGDVDWARYVEWIAEAGSILEDAVTAAKARGEQIAEWYEIVDGCALKFAYMMGEAGDRPQNAAVRVEFDRIIAKHLEEDQNAKR